MFPFEFRRSQTSIPVCVFALSLFQNFEISFPWFTGSKSAFWAWMLWSWGGGRGLLTMAGGEPDMLTIAGEEPDFVSVLWGRGSTIDAGSAGAIVRLGGCNEFEHHVIEHDDVDFSSVLWDAAPVVPVPGAPGDLVPVVPVPVVQRTPVTPRRHRPTHRAFSKSLAMRTLEEKKAFAMNGAAARWSLVRHKKLQVYIKCVCVCVLIVLCSIFKCVENTSTTHSET